MQNININDIYNDRTRTGNTENLIGSAVGNDRKGADTKVSTENQDAPLRNIHIQQPFYMEKDIRTNAQDIEDSLRAGQSELERKNYMVLAMNGMTDQDFTKAKEDGFSFEDMDDREIVTVVDKIKVQLAKGGMDVSAMGGLSDAAMEAAGLTEAGKAELTKAAIGKAGEINSLDDDAKKYLIKNEEEPTIDNVHKAIFSKSSKYEYNNADNGNEPISIEDFDALKGQVENVIKKAGYAVNNESTSGAKWLLDNQLPLTEKTFSMYMELTENDLKTDNTAIMQSIYDAATEGKNPGEAYIVSGLSARESAIITREKIDIITDNQIANAVAKEDPLTIQSIYSQEDNAKAIEDISADPKKEYELISARRAMEEVRLSMTFEASISMRMRGINVDTTSLSNLVDELKSREESLYKALFGDDTYGVNKSIPFEEKISIYEETNLAIDGLKAAPAAILGEFNSVSEITIRGMNDVAKVVRTDEAKFKAFGETFEALMTAPRKDMGDSIKKAFQNVDDILTDLDFEVADSSRRAVRILGYNGLSITRESILNMQVADEEVQRAFKNLTPGVVAKMVREGENPLDIPIDKLNEKIRELKDADDSYSSEDYAEFLYKLDRQNGLSDEERNSFVGIYRLIHQVTESDGAVIGALLNQGAEITMRNMMMAIRSDKHKNREAIIDDSFGEITGLKNFDKNSLSITDQIEMAFQTSRMRDAEESVTPSKLASFESEDVYLNMTPDELAEALTNMPEDAADERAYLENLKQEIAQSVQTETKVYEALKQFDLPVSPINLRAMDAFLSDRNSVYRKVFSNMVTDEDLNKTPREVMAEIMERFGEACKTPTDMADAQQKLAETATNIMRDMIVEKEVSHIDIRGMRVALKQVQMLGKIAEHSENYTIPIIVADENGTLNLKVVRGSDSNNGVVDIAFNMDKTGPVSAVIKASAQGITGSISAVRAGINDILKRNEESLINAISSALGEETNVSFEYSKKDSISDEELYGDKDPGFEVTNEKSDISTRKLYSIARAFIDVLGKIEV